MTVAADQRVAWTVSIVGHVLLAAFLLSGGINFPPEPTVITAQLVLPPSDKTVTTPNKTEEPAEQKPDKKPEPEKQPEQEKQVDQAAAAKAEAAEIARKVQEKADQEKKAAEEKEKQKQDEKALAEAKEKARLEAEKKAQEAAKKKAAEDKKRAEEQKEKARKETERQRIADALAKEELARSQSQVLEQYQSSIMQKVLSHWEPPVDLGPRTLADEDAYQCVAGITQDREGVITDIDVRDCQAQYGKILADSVRQALIEASPLPKPADSALFDPELKLVFTPEE